MVRLSKKARRRRVCPRKKKTLPKTITGPLKENLSLGFKEHTNAAPKEESSYAFIPKIRSSNRLSEK